MNVEKLRSLQIDHVKWVELNKLRKALDNPQKDISSVIFCDAGGCGSEYFKVENPSARKAVLALIKADYDERISVLAARMTAAGIEL